jgi:EEF1A lysine methyltransferase 4
VQDDLATDGYQRIVNIDYAQSCIQHLLNNKDRPAACQYQVADCRCMPEFADGSFASIIDKGTLDGLLCGANSIADATAMLREVGRVLQPGGTFVLITYGHPGMRHKYLLACSVKWEVETWTAAKSDEQLAGANNVEGVKEVLISGPIVEQAELDALGMDESVLFVYTCRKECAGLDTANAVAVPRRGAHDDVE